MVIAVNFETNEQGTGTSAADTVQLRHNRYEIINPADDTGALTLATGVTIAAGYESFATAYVYDTNTSSIQVGNTLTHEDTNFSPFPVPVVVTVAAETGAWEIRNPFTLELLVPSSPFALVYKAKVALQDWDEEAPLIN